MFGREERRLKKELKHDCELPQEEDILVKYINSGIFVFARRKIRHQFLLNEGNYYCKHYLKSSFVMKREKVRHLKWHYYMIHPYSNFAMYVRFIMTVIFLLIFVLTPVQLMIKNETLRTFKVFLDIICIVYVVLCFNMGYRNAKFNRVILNRKDVSKHYILTWFIFDLLSSINFTNTHFCMFFPSYCEYTYILYVLSYLKLLRIITVFQYIEEFRHYTHISMFKCKILKLLLINFFAYIWCSSLVYAAKDDLTKVHSAEHILQCFQNVIYMIFLIGGRDKPTRMAGVLAEILCFIVGTVLRVIVISHLLEIVTKFSSGSSKFYQLIQQLEEFMRYRNLPDILRKRIMNFCDFQYQLNYYKESELLKVLSPSLRQEILVHTYMHLLNKVLVFEDLPISILYTIIYSMKPEIFMPSDVIVIAGTVGDCMYFIGSGTVAVYTPTGKEICHLSDGSNFGEIALLMENEHRVATVVAIDCCELFVLNRKDFTDQLSKYPEVFNRMRKTAQDKVRQTLIASMRGDGLTGDLTTEVESEFQLRK